MEVQNQMQTISLPPLREGQDKKVEVLQKEADSKKESFVLKPSPLDLKARMELVISPEEVKDLLSLITRAPLRHTVKKEDHLVDVRL